MDNCGARSKSVHCSVAHCGLTRAREPENEAAVAKFQYILQLQHFKHEPFVGLKAPCDRTGLNSVNMRATAGAISDLDSREQSTQDIVQLDWVATDQFGSHHVLNCLPNDDLL